MLIRFFWKILNTNCSLQTMPKHFESKANRLIRVLRPAKVSCDCQCNVINKKLVYDSGEVGSNHCLSMKTYWGFVRAANFLNEWSYCTSKTASKLWLEKSKCPQWQEDKAWIGRGKGQTDLHWPLCCVMIEIYFKFICVSSVSNCKLFSNIVTCLVRNQEAEEYPDWYLRKLLFFF